MKKNILLSLFIFLAVILPGVLGDAHLPISLLNAQKSVDLYASMTSFSSIPWQSFKVIFSLNYLVLAVVSILVSLLFFTKKKWNYYFLSSFIFANYISYFFQSGIISLFYVRYSTEIMWFGYILLAISAFIIFYNANKSRFSSKWISFLPWILGLGMGIFYFPIPRKIEKAFEFTITNFAYFYKFLFSLKIILFLVLHLIPIIVVIYLIREGEKGWTYQVNSFLKEKRHLLNYFLGIILIIGLIIVYTFRFQIL